MNRVGFGTNKFDISRFLVVMAVIHVVDLAIMIGAQFYFDRWIFSMDNYYSRKNVDQSVDFSKAATILFFDPLVEEFIFRGYLFFLFSNRYDSRYCY